MDSAGAVYAKVPAGGAAILEAAVREARLAGRSDSPLGVLAFDPAHQTFAIVDRWGRGDDMPDWAEDPDLGLAVELATLSSLVGEVIAFYEVDGGTTMGIYAAWRDGVLVRNLEWAADQWQSARGERQAWEAPLFKRQALQEALDVATDKDRVRALFVAQRIVANACWPRPEGITLAIRTVHPAPDFGFMPWPRRRELVASARRLDGPPRPPPAPAADAPATKASATPAAAAASPALRPKVSTEIHRLNPEAQRMFAPFAVQVRAVGAVARAALAAGDSGTALAEYEKLMALSPVSGDGALGKAAVLIRQGRNREALEWLEELSARRDLEPMKSFMSAVAADREGEEVKAERLYRGLRDSPLLAPDKLAQCVKRADALAQAPAVLLATLSEAIDRIADLADAANTYAQFSLRHPQLAEPYRERGVGLAMLGRNDEALNCFDQAIALDPRVPTAYDHKAVTLLRLERFDDALQAIDAGLQHCPQAGVLLCRRGIVLARMGRLSDALHAYELSIARAPGDNRAWAYKGDVEFQMGDRAAAMATLRHYLALPRLAEDQKVRDAARRQLWAIENPDSKRYPDHGVACLDASIRAEFAGSPQDALALLDQGLASDPLSGKLWFNRGALLRGLGRLDEALTCLRRAEELMGAGLVLKEQVQVLLALGRSEDALHCHERALEAGPGNAFALREKAATLMRLRRSREAVTIYQRLVSRTPADQALLAEYAAARDAAT